MQYSVRMRAFMHSLLVLLVAGLSAPSAAGFEPARIQLDPETPGLLEVHGIWPDTCTPQLFDIEVGKDGLHLNAQREELGCHPSPTPYSLSAALPEDGSERPRRVYFHVGSGNDKSERLLAGFALLPATDSPAIRPESGIWWPEHGGLFEAGPGLGLALESRGGLINLAIMGYDAAGASAWYLAAGELDGNRAQLEAGRFLGGKGPFTLPTRPRSIELSGWIDVEMLSTNRAVLWFSSLDGQKGLKLQPLSVARFHFEQQPADALLGRWLLAGEQDETGAAQWIQWQHSEIFEDGFLLHAASQEATLQCDTATALPGSPPVFCRLELIDGRAMEFDQIGFQRMTGHDATGAPMHLLRLD